jgi:predicted NUDIX family phosphoesterase
MSSTTQTNTQTEQQIQDESILVVRKDALFPHGAWHGIKNKGIESVLSTIQEKKEFLPRSLMEQDFNYKQIIPYIIFEHDHRYFLMQRQSTSSEQRLKNKYSLGIGGHVRAEDLQNGTTIFDWANREFHEEVSYSGQLNLQTLGIINDDTTPVGQVHIGLVLLAHGSNGAISVKSELKSGQLLTLAECSFYYPNMESWSQIIYNQLNNKEE